MRNVNKNLFDQERVALFVGEIREHYDGHSTKTLRETYQYLWEAVFDGSTRLDPVTRKLLEIEWQVIRSILRERGMIA